MNLQEEIMNPNIIGRKILHKMHIEIDETNEFTQSESEITETQTRSTVRFRNYAT